MRQKYIFSSRETLSVLKQTSLIPTVIPLTKSQRCYGFTVLYNSFAPQHKRDGSQSEPPLLCYQQTIVSPVSLSDAPDAKKYIMPAISSGSANRCSLDKDSFSSIFLVA